jgi:glycolate oxidase FAD binding subunit
VDQDQSQALADAVRQACTARRPIAIRGGGSKPFYGRSVEAGEFAVAGHRGIVAYAPTELVLTARAGTPLVEVEAALAERNQVLAFEPPAFGPTATLGGTVACGLSGPARPYAGAVRDFVLGVRLINGKGERLRFGGQVMKNVAGYDIARLMTGAVGTLGILTEISLKVLPRPATTTTLVKQLAPDVAITAMNRWAGRPVPLSATAYDGDNLYLRLSGSQTAVDAARRKIGGEIVADAERFWCNLREHRHPFFTGDRPLWRLCVPATTPALPIEGKWFYDWGGAQRWLRSDAEATLIRRSAQRAGGHAARFRGGDRRGEVFQPLAPALARLHRSLKAAFDPEHILNPGRLYRDL